MRNDSDFLLRTALGAAGGFVGTFAIQALLTASQKWLPSTAPPIRRDPGEFMVEKAEEALPDSVRRHVPESAETVAARGLAVGYGVTFGAIYAACRPRGGNPLLDGIALGAVCWAAGYLGWLPALGLMPPVWRQTAPQAITPAADHLVYGVATVAAYDLLRERVGASAG